MRITQHFKAFGTLVHAVYTVDAIYADDKLDWDDAPTIMAFIGGQALVWSGDFLDWKKAGKKPLYIIEAAILAGGAASYAIGGREGLVTYTDVMTGKVGPGKWYDVVAPAVKGHIIEHVVMPVTREILEKTAELKQFGSFIWHIVERQLERTLPGYRYGI